MPTGLSNILADKTSKLKHEESIHSTGVYRVLIQARYSPHAGTVGMNKTEMSAFVYQERDKINKWTNKPMSIISGLDKCYKESIQGEWVQRQWKASLTFDEKLE